MKIATWNVNSLRVRLPHLLDWLAANSPDAVCLQETKCEDAKFPAAELQAAGYCSVHNGQRTYNGVAILSRVESAGVCRGIPEFTDEQSRVIAADIAGLRLVSVYVPNGQSVGSDKYAYKLAWFAALRRWLDRHDRAVPLVLGGDWNVAPADLDVYDPKKWAGKVLCSEPERDGLRALCGWGLEDAFRRLHPETRAYSWWDYRGAWFWKDQGLRIDHFLIDPTIAARLVECAIDREARKGQDASDHAPVVMTVR